MKNSVKKSVTVLVAAGVLFGGLQAGIAMGAANGLSALKPASVNTYTFKTYTAQQNGAEAQIETLTVSGLGDQKLEKQLNEILAKDSQAAYEQYQQVVAQAQKAGEDTHFALNMDYTIKTDTAQILTIEAAESQAAGSGSYERSYYNVSKTDHKLLTLAGLFKNDGYIQAISKDIPAQMSQRMQADDSLVYDLKSADDPQGFAAIKADQDFYINDKGQLVICFDKYEVAPGYMGAQEFVISLDAIQPLLQDNSPIWF